jgi:hypothetical protein
MAMLLGWELSRDAWEYDDDGWHRPWCHPTIRYTTKTAKVAIDVSLAHQPTITEA